METRRYFRKCYRCGELIDTTHLTNISVECGPAYDICDDCLDKFLSFIEGSEIAETLETDDLEW